MEENNDGDDGSSFPSPKRRKLERKLDSKVNQKLNSNCSTPTQQSEREPLLDLCHTYIKENGESQTTLENQILEECRQKCQNFFTQFLKSSNNSEIEEAIEFKSQDEKQMASILIKSSEIQDTKELILGRNSVIPENKKMSRNQVQLTLEHQTTPEKRLVVKLVALGKNPIFLWRRGSSNGEEAEKEKVYELNHGDIFSLCGVDYKLRVVYHPMIQKLANEVDEELVELLENAAQILNYYSSSYFSVKLLYRVCQYLKQFAEEMQGSEKKNVRLFQIILRLGQFCYLHLVKVETLAPF